MEAANLLVICDVCDRDVLSHIEITTDSNGWARSELFAVSCCITGWRLDQRIDLAC